MGVRERTIAPLSVHDRQTRAAVSDPRERLGRRVESIQAVHIESLSEVPAHRNLDNPKFGFSLGHSHFGRPGPNQNSYVVLEAIF